MHIQRVWHLSLQISHVTACFHQKPNLKGSKIGVDEDRTPAQQAEHFRLVQMMREARAEKKNARIMGGRLFVNGVIVEASKAPLVGKAAATKAAALSS